MEIMKRHHAVLERIVSVHSGKQITVVASAVEVNVACHLRIIKSTLNGYDVIDITGDRNIRRYKSCDILHPHTRRVYCKIYTACAGKAYRTFHKPVDVAVIFH